jgi:Cu-Zn family superoxide dismutase
MRLVSATVAAVLLAAGHVQMMPAANAQPARAAVKLEPTKGNNASGEATFQQVGNKVRVVVVVQGLKPGQVHGLHIHEVGDCRSADGMSTKGHYNPLGKPHGPQGSADRHAGDLPSLKADDAGRAKIDVEVDIITVTAGPTSVVGRGLIVHADPDDYKTQPTGNAGARIACGVIQPG